MNAQGIEDWVEMAAELWPDYDPTELEAVLRTELRSDRHKHFLGYATDGNATGFISLSIRSDYVEGASSDRVAYIEGIYVKPAFRKQGIARQLVARAETWAREQGCSEIGSDTELHNTESQNFHSRIGFEKVETVVHFIKQL